MRIKGYVNPTPLCREDKGLFNTVLDAVKTNFTDRYDDVRKRWGGGIMGAKAQAARAKLEKAKARETASKLG